MNNFNGQLAASLAWDLETSKDCSINPEAAQGLRASQS
jgi:hypothetical protein